MRTIRSIEDLKVGDKFVVVKEKSGRGWNSEGRMDKYLGKTLTVSSLKTDNVGALESEHDQEGLGFWFYEHMINWGETEQINNQLPQPHKSLLKSGDKVYYTDCEEYFIAVIEYGYTCAELVKGEEYQRPFTRPLVKHTDDLLFGTNKTPVYEIWRGDELIAKRIEKSAKEIEIERIGNEMRKLADDLRNVKGE